ncbi:3-isopropylmalate dehydrogenase [Rhodohalobacter mucosus]|uniref:3-isopropylmalate dehydrogenase n=1 Tax=Rhodohalobacter mucosus TaxID=2079485 RepID=A0A316TTZ0_9BACT|nr:3-isopropylmalate dehydrogenase [Rhodohalobacter mucosus]
MKKTIITLPGDGIGPEVTDVAVNVLKAACLPFDVEIETIERNFGGSGYDIDGVPVTKETLELCKKHKSVLLGAVGGPKWENLSSELRPEAALLALRRELGVYANLRPIRVHSALAGASALKEEIISGTDILIVRELTGGIYFGEPRFTVEENGDTFSVDTMKYSRNEVRRIARKAFEAAMLRSKKVCSVDKANVLESSRLWRNSVEEIGAEFPEVELTHMLVDNCAMQLIRNPKQFDVILTGNLFGDIISDEAAMLTGSIGMLPSASLGNGNGLYEPVHGSAPDIAGTGAANPLAAVASAALLCRYSLQLKEASEDIERAVQAVLNQGYRTEDIFRGRSGTKLVGTHEMGDKLIRNLKAHTYAD